MARLTFICVLAILFAVRGVAAPVSDRELATMWQDGDVPQMQKLAEAGDVRAQHWMGLMLHNRSRYDEAIYWYGRAVEQGDAKSANRIAFFYEHGIGRAKNAREALVWHSKGAALGDFSSQVTFAAALRSGEVLARDEREAFKWYAKAAAQRRYGQRGYAYLPLAEMYENGTGVRRNLTLAYAFAKAGELTVDDSDTASLQRADSVRARVARQLQPVELAAGEQLFQTLVADVLERQARRRQTWTERVLLFSLLGVLLGAGIILLKRSRRAAPHPKT